MRQIITAAACASAALITAPAARASEAEARTYFNIGAQAFATQRYDEAILAFEKAYAASARPGIRFSLAQAHRRRYGKTRDIEDAKKALELFRAYVGEQKVGGRVDDALAAIGELEAIASAAAPAAATPASDAATASPRTDPPKTETMLMVGASQRGATISLDGGSPMPAPLTKVVSPGRHRVRVAAPGFAPEEREVDAVANQTIAYDVSLRELPATLSLAVEAGAQVSIDGRFVGTTPFPRPLELTPGRHLVVVGKSGHKSVAAELVFKRGQTRRMRVSLAQTGQRTAGYVLLGGGITSLIGGGVLGAVAFAEQTRAKELDAARSNGALRSASDYNTALAARDRFRAGSMIALGTGAALGLAGLLAIGLDPADLSGANPRVEKGDRPTREPAPAPGAIPSMEMGALPLLMPGAAGAALIGRF